MSEPLSDEKLADARFRADADMKSNVPQYVNRGTMMQWLLAEVDRLRAENAELRETLERERAESKLRLEGLRQLDEALGFREPLKD